MKSQKAQIDITARQILAYDRRVRAYVAKHAWDYVENSLLLEKLAQ